MTDEFDSYRFSENLDEQRNFDTDEVNLEHEDDKSKNIPRRRLRRRINSNDRPTAAQLEAELKREQHKSRYSTVLRSTVYTVIVVAAVSILVATLFLPVLQIYGSSMTPTLSEGDIVVSVKETDYEIGSVYAFYYQNNILCKRLIATSGQWVDIDTDGNVHVDGVLLDEPYLSEGAKALGTTDLTYPYQVPEGRVFMMGDHRATSIDSRTTEVGCVSEEYIVGRIVFRLWPLSGFGWVK